MLATSSPTNQYHFIINNSCRVVLDIAFRSLLLSVRARKTTFTLAYTQIHSLVNIHIYLRYWIEIKICANNFEFVAQQYKLFFSSGIIYYTAPKTGIKLNKEEKTHTNKKQSLAHKTNTILVFADEQMEADRRSRQVLVFATIVQKLT